MNLDYFLHLYPCKIDKENQELLKIKSCSIKEHEKLSKQEGDEEAKEEDDSGNNPKSLDCTCKSTANKKPWKAGFLTWPRLFKRWIALFLLPLRKYFVPAK